MSTILKLLQSKTAKWIGTSIFVLGSFGALVIKYQEVRRDRESISAKLKELTLAYTHMAQENKYLAQTITTLKKKIYTLITQLPDGTVITSVSEFIDSTTVSTTSSQGSSNPVFPAGNKIDRYPLRIVVTTSNIGWGIGPGWEFGKFNLPFLPYTYAAMDIPLGKTYDNRFMGGAVLSLQWGRK